MFKEGTSYILPYFFAFKIFWYDLCNVLEIVICDMIIGAKYHIIWCESYVYLANLYHKTTEMA